MRRSRLLILDRAAEEDFAAFPCVIRFHRLCGTGHVLRRREPAVRALDATHREVFIASSFVVRTADRASRMPARGPLDPPHHRASGWPVEIKFVLKQFVSVKGD